MTRKKTTLKEVLEHLERGEQLTISQLFGLSDLGRAEATKFCAVWARIQSVQRARITRQLVELAEDNFEADFKAVFRICLTDENEEVRSWAIEGLWEDEREDLVPVLVEIAQHDVAARVRASAVTALGRFVLLSELREWGEMRNHLVNAVLVPIIDRPEEELEVRRRAIEAIAHSSDKDVPALIQSAYFSGEDEKMRVSAVFAMGRSADSRWNAIVVDELHSLNPEMRYEAARACGELATRAAVKPLIVLMEEDPDREVQEATIWALGQIGGERARLALKRCYDTRDESLCEAVEEALDELELAAETKDWVTSDVGPAVVDELEDNFDELDNDFAPSHERDSWDADWEAYRSSAVYVDIDEDF